jgi:hypothetical protein
VIRIEWNDLAAIDSARRRIVLRREGSVLDGSYPVSKVPFGVDNTGYRDMCKELQHCNPSRVDIQ